MEQLVAENARAARQLMGVPTLSPSTGGHDADAALQLRTRVMLRSLYPQAAPPPATPVAAAVKSSAQSTGALIAVAPKGPAAAGNRPHQVPAVAVTGDSLIVGVKRGRDDPTGGDGCTNPILSVDPKQLRNQHALVVAASAHDAAATTTDASGRTVAYGPPPKWKMSKVLVGHQGWVWAAAVDPTNSWFATGGFDAVIKVWDLSSGALKMNLTGHKEAVRSIALSPSSPYMFSGSDDHAIKCWDLERNEVVREFFGHRSAVHCVAVHPTLDLVFSGGRDQTVRVWDVRTRACVHTMDGHTDSVMSLACQQGEPQVLSGGSDGMIYMWDIASGRSITRLTRHKKPVRGLAITPPGSQLISCGADEIRVWKLPTGEFECNASTILDKAARKAGSRGGAPVEPEEELAYRWSCCAVSPRNVLAVGSQDGHLGLYDASRPQSRLSNTKFYCPYQMTKTRSIPGTITGEGGINCVVFDASGTRMITAESDKSVKIWKLRDD